MVYIGRWKRCIRSAYVMADIAAPDYVCCNDSGGYEMIIVKVIGSFICIM